MSDLKNLAKNNKLKENNEVNIIHFDVQLNPINSKKTVEVNSRIRDD